MKTIAQKKEVKGSWKEKRKRGKKQEGRRNTIDIRYHSIPTNTGLRISQPFLIFVLQLLSNFIKHNL